MKQLALFVLPFALVACNACGAEPPPADAAPEAKTCPKVEPCCDAGKWICTTTEVPCVCPKP